MKGAGEKRGVNYKLLDPSSHKMDGNYYEDIILVDDESGEVTEITDDQD